jgi:hypothetical protein
MTVPVANLPWQGWTRMLTTDEGLFQRKHRCQRCGAALRIGTWARHEFWPEPVVLGNCCAKKMVSGLGNSAPALLRARLQSLRETWTQGWFPTAIRNGYLRNVAGRFALATAIIVPALRQVLESWRERTESCWVCYVYLPGGTRLCRTARTPVAAAEAAYSFLAELHQ